MDNFCKMCGAELRNNAKFCHKCGTVQSTSLSDVVDNTGNNNINASQNDSIKTNNTNKIKIYIGVLVLIVIFLAKGYAAFHAGSGLLERVKGALNIGTQVTTENESKAPTNPSTSKESITVNTVANQAESELIQRGIQGTVVASSKGHSNSGYVSLVNNNGQYQIVTYDIKNGRVGTTPYARNILYFTDKKPTSGGNETIIFNLTVLNDNHDNDNNAGVWEGANHNIPVYAAYKFDGSGNLVPGMLTTGKGAKPSHYQEYFYETRNVDTINLFLTEMMALQKNIADNKVALP